MLRIIISLIFTSSLAFTEMRASEVLPVPETIPQPIPANEAPTTEAPVVTLNPISFEWCRKTAVQLKISANTLKHHFRGKIGRSHPASWLADAIRRDAEQLEFGCIDKVPQSLIVRNIFEIDAEARELADLIRQLDIVPIERHIRERFFQMYADADSFMTQLGILQEPILFDSNVPRRHR